MGIVDIALSQEGTKEAKTNNVMYNTWYYGHPVSGGSYPWCAVFVSWCAEQAGVSHNIIPKTSSVSTLYTFFRNKKLFHDKGSGYIPKPGDILIQKSGGASHTGLVYAADSSKFYTIEGNAGDKVSKRSYSYDDSRLTGFGSPNYNGDSMSESSSDSDKNTGTGSSSGTSLGVGEYDYTAYTVKPGDTLDSIAQKFGCTSSMILFLNSLASSELTAGQKLQVPTIEQKQDPTTGVGSIVKRHASGVVVSHPTIEVEFYGEYERLAAIGSIGFTSADDVDNDIISVNTMRDMGQDCPTFTISLTWKRDWYHNLASNDLVIIKMQRPPESKSAVFFGLVDDIRKVTDFSSGQPQRAVQVTGRGFAKALVNFDVGLIENVTPNMGDGFFIGLTDIQGCNSYDAIKIVIDSYIGKAIKYKFGNGKLFEEYFSYPEVTYQNNNLSTHGEENLQDYTSYTSYNGSLWNFIKELSNTPFNETYWEVYDEKPSLIHRRTPFNKSDWTSLPRCLVKDTDIVSDNTGRSDLETYTLYSVQPSLLNDESMLPYRPLWYPPFYEKYGITRLEVSTNYVGFQGNVSSFFKELFNYNIKNNVFSNGTIVVKGSNKYHVGQRIIIQSENMEYYVENVSHNFNCYGSWTTSLGVTRGIEPENRFTAPWDCAEELSPEMMYAIITQTSGEQINWNNLPKYTINNNPNNNNNKPNNQTGTSGTPSENETKVYNTLRDWGLNDAACAAVLANINAESGFVTDVWGDNHTSLGLCQWHNSRCTELQEFCENNGYLITSVEGQMAYLKTELEHGHSSTWEVLNSAPNTSQGAYDAAYYWCVNFERPENKYTKGKERGNVAKFTYFPRYSS